jgi:hypothetical protein
MQEGREMQEGRATQHGQINVPVKPFSMNIISSTSAVCDLVHNVQIACLCPLTFVSFFNDILFHC